MDNKQNWIRSLFGHKSAKQANPPLPTPQAPSQAASSQHGTDLRLELTITPEEATGGCQKEIVVLRDERCQACDGKSQDATTRCGQCHGDGRVQKNRRIALKIPAGARDGMNIRLTGAGNAGPSGSTPGNLYIVLSVKSAKPTSTPPVASRRRVEDLVPVDWKVGDCILDEFDVTGIVGKGGMGIVYKIYHRQSKGTLIVKSPRPEIFVREGGKENFIREAETWMNLRRHPHLVSCHFVRTLGGIPRIFADYIDGGSLVDWIRTLRLYQDGPERALERMMDIAIQFAWGLHAAHEQGLVHQDVKPANVMMTLEGIAKVTDFGLARAREMAGEQKRAQEQGHQSLLVSGRGMTPAYCSPEQATGQKLSRKTDIWSWGLSVLEMFTGRVTWSVGIAAQEALAHYKGQNPIIPVIPPAVRNVLRRCFELQPENRPATMLEVATELQVIYAQVVGHPYAREMPESAEIGVHSWINRGVSLSELGKPEEARAAFEEAIRLAPNFAVIYHTQGIAFHNLGRHEEALVALEQAIRLNPNEAGAYNEKAFVLQDLRRHEEALVALEQAIRLAPHFARAYYNKGNALRKLGRPEEALAAYEQAIRLDPNDASASCNKGYALYDLERYEEALVSFEQAIRLDPNSPDVHIGKGAVLRQRGRLEEALVFFEQAAHLDPTYAVAAYNKGRILQDLGRHEEALVAYEQAIRLDPNDANAHYNKGILLYNRKRLGEALLAFDQVIRLDPTYANVHTAKGVVQQDLGRLEEALATFEQAIQINPKDGLAHKNMGFVLLMLKRPEKALLAYEQAIRINPNDASAHGNKGIVLLVLRRLEEALEAYEQSIRLNPTDASAYVNKGSLLQGLRRYKEALAAYEQALRLNPRDVDAYASKGSVLQHLGRLQEALEAYEQVIYLDPNNANAHHDKAVVLGALGRLKEAEQAYQKAQKISGSN
jgi:tetratricopeptide (TPR) repeat protein